MLTGGGPNFVGAPYVVGHTDILISMVYSVAFEERQQAIRRGQRAVTRDLRDGRHHLVGRFRRTRSSRGDLTMSRPPSARRPPPPTARPGTRPADAGGASSAGATLVGVVMIVYRVFPLLYVALGVSEPGGNAHRLVRPVPRRCSLAELRRPRRHPVLDLDAQLARWCRRSPRPARCSWAQRRPTPSRASGSADAGRGSPTLLLLQMFPQMLAFVAIFLVLHRDRRRLPGARAELAASD